MNWLQRLTHVVLPALVEGIPIYTGVGELHPGPGIAHGTGNRVETQDAAKMKPIGMPIWQVYLGAKANQPALRFLQLLQKVRNPVGSATMTYPTRLRDEKLGVPLIVPLGEGLETPDNEQHVARDLLASVMYKPVKVIALGRVRFFTTTSPWSLYEPIVLEVYSEDGERIWTNPFIGMTLEEAIACLERGDRFLSKVSLPVAKSNSVRLNRQVVDEEIRNLVEQGCPDEEIQAHLILTRGMDQMVIDRLIHAFRSRTEYSAEIQALVRHCARLFAPYFEGEELCRAVAEASGQGMDVVQGVLKGRPLEF